MLRANTAATIESSLPQGKLTGARETVRAQSDRLDDAIGCWSRNWGDRNDVVVAINGDWIYLDTAGSTAAKSIPAGTARRSTASSGAASSHGRLAACPS